MVRSDDCGSWTVQAGLSPRYSNSNGKDSSPRSRRLRAQLQSHPALLVFAAFGFVMCLFGFLATHEALSRMASALARGPDALVLPGWHHSDRLVDGVQHRLLLATHNVLGWYFPQYDAFEVIHKGEGVHYGMFPGEGVPGHPHTLWNIIRKHNWREPEGKEHLVQFDADTGVELNRIEVPARFTHDAVRVGRHVYVCSTGDGSVLELSYPGMKLVRKLQLFSQADHPNTLAAAPGPQEQAVNSDTAEHLWVLLHNLGPSDLVKIYVGPDGPPREVARIKNIGTKAHGLVSWGKAGLLVLLDSENGMLVSLDPTNGDEVELWQVPEEGKFLKGLAVLDDIAYFGITTWSHRSARDNPASHGELAAFDLVRNILLWRRKVPTSGLLNIIGAPHLAADSTYIATYTHTPLPASAIPVDFSKPQESSPGGAAATAAAAQHAPVGTSPVVLPDSRAMVQKALDKLTDAGFPLPPLSPTGYWSSGWPRLESVPKLTDLPELAGLQLPLFHAEISALKAKLLSLPSSMWTKEEQAKSNVVMTGRSANTEKFKPGVQGMVLVFSDNNGETVYQFPYYNLFRQELETLVNEIVGPIDALNIVRIQFALMPPGTSDIKLHVDSGGYAKRGHRIHIPIITHENVSFDVCPQVPASLAAAAAVIANMSVAAATAAAAATHGGAAAAAASTASTENAPLSTTASSLESFSVTADDNRSQGRGVQASAGANLPASALEAVSSLHIPATLAPGGTMQSLGRNLQQLTLQLQPKGDKRRRSQAASVSDADAGLNCVNILAPEGLVFELNNRVLHKVANPGPGPRVHLVIDVFEHQRPRTLVPAGSVCEYGPRLSALQQFNQIMQIASSGKLDEEQLAHEIEVMLLTAGMSCTTPDGQRLVPKLGPVDEDQAAEKVRQQEELLRLVAEGVAQRRGQSEHVASD